MPRIHTTQKPIQLLQNLVRLFTDPDDVVIDPCAGSGSALIAAAGIGRRAYGFEIKKATYADACKAIGQYTQLDLFDTPAQVQHEQKQASIFN